VLYGVNGLAESKLDELIKYYIVEPNLSAIPQGVFINMERWKELPEDIRESLLRNSPYVFQTLNRDYEMNVEFILRNCEQKYGMERVVLSDEDKKKVEDTCYNTLWPKVAAMSENCAKLVNIVKEQQKQLGKLK
jgi:TRAP-type C4-dicarboxylate transport system substrate-binding protein